jgi:hypothetical protein
MSDFPFLYLDPDPDFCPTGKRWWERKLKHLFRDLGPEELARSKLARSILAVEFFPYVSRRYRGMPRVPSQQYSLNLVRHVMERRAFIVLTRGQDFLVPSSLSR